MLQDRKIQCLQARPYIIQPGNFTGWGSEGIKQPKRRIEITAVMLPLPAKAIIEEKTKTCTSRVPLKTTEYSRIILRHIINTAGEQETGKSRMGRGHCVIDISATRASNFEHELVTSGDK